MAIKGKGRTKSRQPTRAPRREPVEVKKPFFLRRGVQISVAFLAGFLAMMLLIWVTNGLRQQSADKKAATEAAQQRAAGEKWKTEVEGALGPLGTLSPGANPVLLSEIGTTIASLQKGEVPTGAAKTLQAAQDQAKTAADALHAYKLVDQVSGIGMSEGQVDWFLNSQKRIVQSLELSQQAAATAALAIDATGAQRKAIADQAFQLNATAAELLTDGWGDYQNALSSVGLVQTPTLPGVPGLPGSTGLPGVTGSGS